MIKNSFVFKFFFSLSVFGFMGCNAPEGMQSAQSQNTIVDGSDINPVALLKDLSEEELTEVSEGCPIESGRDFCVVICHIPPGNPKNAKSLLIPHQAVEAHINHGGENHKHHDYVGNCDEIPESTDNICKGNSKNCSPVDDEDSTDSVDNDEYNNEVPMFCDPLFITDLDCDGLNDDSMEPIY